MQLTILSAVSTGLFVQNQGKDVLFLPNCFLPTAEQDIRIYFNSSTAGASKQLEPTQKPCQDCKLKDALDKAYGLTFISIIILKHQTLYFEIFVSRTIFREK